MNSNTQNSRTLKIEESGDFSIGRIKPKIRITGNWLERAGFIPGQRVQVIFIGPGIMELRSSATNYLTNVSQFSGAQLSQVSDLRESSDMETL
jgi:hypothetical protein